MRSRTARPVLWACVLGAAAVGVRGGYADYGTDVGVPVPLGGDRAPPAAEQLWHENAQISWNPARLFKPDESLSFKYIKAGGVDLHFLDHTHLEGFDAQVRALVLAPRPPLPPPPSPPPRVQLALLRGGACAGRRRLITRGLFCPAQELISMGPYTVETRLGQ